MNLDSSFADGLVIAGHWVSHDAAKAKLIDYSSEHPRTLERYDFGNPGDPNQLTEEEVRRTWDLNPHITKPQLAWFVEHARSAPWVDVDAKADLRDADPALAGGLYTAMSALYEHFMTWGVKEAKVSKVLHLKRPRLFPILDQRVLKTYRRARREQRYPQLIEWTTWAAIREDLLAATRSGALERLRTSMADDPKEHVKVLAELRDLRLLDILTWRS